MESDKLDHDKMLANFHPIPAWFSSCLLNQSCQILSVQAAVSTVQWQVEGRLLEQILQGCWVVSGVLVTFTILYQ